MKTILCIPGLGGHPSVFAQYPKLLPEYRLEFVELVNRDKAIADARAIIQKADGRVALFCHCYAAQIGIQLAAEMPEKVSELIFLEPFFGEFHPWMRFLRPLNVALSTIVKFFVGIGVHRGRLTYQPDYVALAKYPIYLQPFFDMRWQNLTDYLDKCYDILTYQLPQRVEIPTLMIFSPRGFSRNSATREGLKKAFPRAHLMEMKVGTHNVITMDSAAVAVATREVLAAVG